MWEFSVFVLSFVVHDSIDQRRISTESGKIDVENPCDTLILVSFVLWLWSCVSEIPRRPRIKSYHAGCRESALSDTFLFVCFIIWNRWGGDESVIVFLIWDLLRLQNVHVTGRSFRLGRLLEKKSFAFASRVRKIVCSLFLNLPCIVIWLFARRSVITSATHIASPRYKVHDLKRRIQRHLPTECRNPRENYETFMSFQDPTNPDRLEWLILNSSSFSFKSMSSDSGRSSSYFFTSMFSDLRDSHLRVFEDWIRMYLSFLDTNDTFSLLSASNSLIVLIYFFERDILSESVVIFWQVSRWVQDSTGKSKDQI